MLAAAALIPLAWLIGEATDQAAYHTGAGIGGFLNASFGNAPELILALVAVSDGLTEVVRASLVGSIAGNLLLVLGFTLVLGQAGAIDRRSAGISLGLVALATFLVFVGSVPGFHGDPDRHSLAEVSLPFAAVLLLVRFTVTRKALRRQRALKVAAAPTGAAGWSLGAALAVGRLGERRNRVRHGLARRFAADVREPSSSVAVLRRGRDPRNRRQHHRARQCSATCTARQYPARDRNLLGVIRAASRPSLV